MKVIDLLNKIANGEIEEDTMFEYSHGNGYKEYCSARQFFSRYIVDKENLNLEIYEDKEDKKIEKLTHLNNVSNASDLVAISQMQWENNSIVERKINEIIDRINEEK